jgi:hypothetical protein
VYYMGTVVVNGCTCTGLVKRYRGIRLVWVHTGAVVVQCYAGTEVIKGYRCSTELQE